MKKNEMILPIIFVLTISIVNSCSTTTLRFDRTLLKSTENYINPKLPKLTVEKADTLQLGSSNQVESSSLLYTIFRREVEDNVCESVGESVGFIKMELIYADVEQNPGWSSKNLAVLEFEVLIFDNFNNEIWANVYSGEMDDQNSNLLWRLSFSDQAANNAMAKIAHKLIEDMKSDISVDYASIINNL